MLELLISLIIQLKDYRGNQTSRTISWKKSFKNESFLSDEIANDGLLNFSSQKINNNFFFFQKLRTSKLEDQFEDEAEIKIKQKKICYKNTFSSFY